MMLKIEDAINSLDYHDLVDLHEDLREGGHAFRKKIEERIVQKEKEQGKFCSVCNNEIDIHSLGNYTLLLGPEGLRRKASFCAMDCLKFFITQLEERKAALLKKREET
jgi:ADP-heptose:LPS heptosyltransferase